MDEQEKRWNQIKVKLWNPAIANLTMMVIGSCAPEILLIIIESIQNLGNSQKELIGPSTLIGSAAFNSIFITAVSVYAPSKQIDYVKILF